MFMDETMYFEEHLSNATLREKYASFPPSHEPRQHNDLGITWNRDIISSRTMATRLSLTVLQLHLPGKIRETGGGAT
jgi:hypothetical protein